LDVDRHRSIVHNWVQKAELRPTDGADPDHVAVDETVIQLNDERFWLYAAVDPETNRLLHMKH
jgi:putative transposase